MAAQPAAAQATEAADDDDEDETAAWSLEKRTAEELGAELAAQWAAPIDALSKAGKAFEGLEALLGGASGGSFDLKVLHSSLSDQEPGYYIVQSCSSQRFKHTFSFGTRGNTSNHTSQHSLRGCRTPHSTQEPVEQKFVASVTGGHRQVTNWLLLERQPALASRRTHSADSGATLPGSCPSHTRPRAWQC